MSAAKRLNERSIESLPNRRITIHREMRPTETAVTTLLATRARITFARNDRIMCKSPAFDGRHFDRLRQRSRIALSADGSTSIYPDARFYVTPGRRADS